MKKKEASSAAQPQARDFQLPLVTHFSLVGARMTRSGDKQGIGLGPSHPVPGGSLPGTAPLRHGQALDHNWLKIDWVQDGVGGIYLQLENFKMNFPF